MRCCGNSVSATREDIYGIGILEEGLIEVDAYSIETDIALYFISLWLKVEADALSLTSAVNLHTTDTRYLSVFCLFLLNLSSTLISAKHS